MTEANPFVALLRDVTIWIPDHDGLTAPAEIQGMDHGWVKKGEVLAALAAAVPDDLADAGTVAEECFAAVNGEGKRACDWADKPHRLVYDLCRTIRALIARIAAQEAQMKELEERVKKAEKGAAALVDKALSADIALAAAVPAVPDAREEWLNDC